MTELNLSADSTVGTIAELLPGATEVFRRAGVGFCCGGDERLADAVAHQGGDLAAILTELQALVARSANRPPVETPALIDHILQRFHAVHREELAWLVPLARKVEMVHGDHEAAPLGLTALLEEIAGDLDAHMAKEEQVLFPLMLQGGHPMIRHPIAAMMADHDHEEIHLAQIEALTGGLVLPEGACRSWTALYGGLQKFRDDLRAHMALENGVLFARFLPEDAAALAG